MTKPRTKAGGWDIVHSFEDFIWEDAENETRRGVLQEMVAVLLNKLDHERSAGAAPAPLDVEALDYEVLRMERGWPTPISMRQAADALDMLVIPRYGDVLRWVADACDARLLDAAPSQPKGTGWTWKGDGTPGDRHGAGDGWVHIHPDGTRWIHPKKICPLPPTDGEDR